jgi:hypothetical protein
LALASFIQLLMASECADVSSTIGHFWYPNTIVNGAAADARDPRNQTYQRLMSRNDKLTADGY